MKRVRHILYLGHRYVGLAMAVFLTVAALTGSLLAFREPIERLVAPQLYAQPRPGVAPLDLPTLVARAQEQLPHARVDGVTLMHPDQAVVIPTPKTDPSTGKPYNLGFSQFYIDPWTGKELAHRNRNDISDGLINLMPFMLQLHDKLVLGPGGYIFMGIVALFWTIDCFVALYLTMPPVAAHFFRHWKPSWLIKTNAGPYRLNLDLHRAFGLWLWPMFLVFAWSGVMYNLRPWVYEPVTKALFGLNDRSVAQDFAALRNSRKGAKPMDKVDWNHALAEGRRLLADKAAQEGTMLGEPRSLAYMAPFNSYSYGATVGHGDEMRMVMFDPATSETLFYLNPNPKKMGRGETISRWLSRLHTAHSIGPIYQTFVAFLGLVIAMFSVTGVYLWWKKRSVRVFKKSAAAELQQESVGAPV
ncbi:MAG: PepSY-associated TM helix domain-containing protein [Bryobacteraceae bacterium]